APWIFGDKHRNFYVEPIFLGPNQTQIDVSQQLKNAIAQFEHVGSPANTTPAAIAMQHDPFKVRWYAFYHPLVCEFRIALLSGGIQLLTSRETQFRKTAFNFDTTYKPRDILLPGRSAKDGGLREDVDFTPRGAYSLYNWELFYHAPFLIATRLSKN